MKDMRVIHYSVLPLMAAVLFTVTVAADATSTIQDGDAPGQNAAGDANAPAVASDPPRFLPLPERGPVPPIYRAEVPDAKRYAFDEKAESFADQINRIRRRSLEGSRTSPRREAAYEELTQLTDPAAFRPMYEVLRRMDDQVRLFVLDHFAEQGEHGQGALAWVAIYMTQRERVGRAERLWNEAVRRMTVPAPDSVLQEIDAALRSTDHATVNLAARLARELEAVEAIPLLAMVQVATRYRTPPPRRVVTISPSGGLELYSLDVYPVVTSDIGEYQIVPADANQSVIVRAHGDRAYFYRVDAHRALVLLSTLAYGESTAGLGFDMTAWWHWYNDKFLPKVEEHHERSPEQGRE